jgi:hypothetical protein
MVGTKLGTFDPYTLKLGHGPTEFQKLADITLDM